MWYLIVSIPDLCTLTYFQDQLSLNAGQKYCRMLQGEHSAILCTFIKLSFVIKTFFFIFEWQLETDFTVCHFLLYVNSVQFLTLSSTVMASVAFTSCLLMFLYNANTMGPRSDCSLGSNLNRAHIVSFVKKKVKSELHLNICNRHLKHTTFSGQEQLRGKG